MKFIGDNGRIIETNEDIIIASLKKNPEYKEYKPKNKDGKGKNDKNSDKPSDPEK